MNYKTKIFFASIDKTADNKFNEWIRDKNIEILNFKYQQARYGDRSIAILYKENA